MDTPRPRHGAHGPHGSFHGHVMEDVDVAVLHASARLLQLLPGQFFGDVGDPGRDALTR